LHCSLFVPALLLLCISIFCYMLSFCSVPVCFTTCFVLLRPTLFRYPFLPALFYSAQLSFATCFASAPSQFETDCSHAPVATLLPAHLGQMKAKHRAAHRRQHLLDLGIATFRVPGNHQWRVPRKVTQIKIEAWVSLERSEGEP